MMKIQFDFGYYYYQNFLLPLIWVLFGSAAFIHGVLYLIKQTKLSNKGFLYYVEKNPREYVVLIAVLLLIPLRGIVLANSGIYLLHEKEKDWVVVTGEVEEISQLSQIEGGKYYDENDNFKGFGEKVIVNDSKYYLQYGDLNVGDHVIMKVLPKSKLVLELSVMSKQDDGS